MDKTEFFDEIARDWENEHNNQREKKKLKNLFKHFSLAQRDSVLDAGCGTGRLVPLIRKRIGKEGILVESDFSAEMLRIAKDKYKQPLLFFIQADAQQMPLKGSLFDVIICFALFPHLKDRERALREFHRILKPGKSLFIAHPMSREELNRFHSQVKGPVNRDFLPHEKEMERLLSAAGFGEISIVDKPSFYIAQAKA